MLITVLGTFMQKNCVSDVKPCFMQNSFNKKRGVSYGKITL